MQEQWSLDEGSKQLLAAPPQSGIEDLVTYARPLVLDISFAVVEVDEYDGCKIDPPEKGINVLLGCDALPSDGGEDGDLGWNFSKTFLPAPSETLPELLQRIAKGLGIDPNETIWESAD